MLYRITDNIGEREEMIETDDPESAALEWADRRDPMGADDYRGAMDMIVVVTDEDSVQTPISLDAEWEITYTAMRLD